eukprot:2017201-Prymnesium_polylepis.1
MRGPGDSATGPEPPRESGRGDRGIRRASVQAVTSCHVLRVRACRHDSCIQPSVCVMRRPVPARDVLCPIGRGYRWAGGLLSPPYATLAR